MNYSEQQIESLKERGRQLFDAMQENLSWQASRTDEDIAANPDPLADVFGDARSDPEKYRADARREQDNLDRQGREEFGEEFAEAQIKNLTA